MRYSRFDNFLKVVKSIYLQIKKRSDCVSERFFI